MTRTREISVITCIWNQSEEFFSECATSVSALSADVEWLIIDDGSSAEAAKSYRDIVDSIAGHVPVQVITLPRRSGLSRARNIALERARGQWVVVLDSDDRLVPNLGEMLGQLPSHIGLVAFEARYFNYNMCEHRRLHHFERLFNLYGGTTLDPFLWFDFYYHGIIARHHVLHQIGGYLNELEMGEDQDILFRAVESLTIDQVRFIHEVGYEYRNNPNGLCNQQWDVVKANYIATMLTAMKRRGLSFQDCRYGGIKRIDGAQIDQYEYKLPKGTWLSWDDCYTEYQRERGIVGEFRD